MGMPINLSDDGEISSPQLMHPPAFRYSRSMAFRHCQLSKVGSSKFKLLCKKERNKILLISCIYHNGVVLLVVCVK